MRKPRRLRTSPPCCGRAAPDSVDLPEPAGEFVPVGVYLGLRSKKGRCPGVLTFLLLFSRERKK
jgi:hypothetical protein